MRVGALVLFASFGYACVVVGAAVLRLGRLGPVAVRAGGIVAAAGAVSAVAALSLPAIRFPSETFDGFRGLDPLSVLAAVLLAAVIVAAAVAVGLDSLRVPAALCLLGVLGGNLLIQRFTARDLAVETGLWWTTGGAAVSLIGALVAAGGVRGAPETRR